MGTGPGVVGIAKGGGRRSTNGCNGSCTGDNNGEYCFAVFYRRNNAARRKGAQKERIRCRTTGGHEGCRRNVAGIDQRKSTEGSSQRFGHARSDMETRIFAGTTDCKTGNGNHSEQVFVFPLSTENQEKQQQQQQQQQQLRATATTTAPRRRRKLSARLERMQSTPGSPGTTNETSHSVFAPEPRQAVSVSHQGDRRDRAVGPIDAADHAVDCTEQNNAEIDLGIQKW
mmetsp:Transcript_5072/g.10432  ORF Transcript_5072/g.10432 Transcript_5072/m.10432 type:complete len:228 (+) Transcript_5072:2172-2855(+)